MERLVPPRDRRLAGRLDDRLLAEPGAAAAAMAATLADEFRYMLQWLSYALSAEVEPPTLDHEEVNQDLGETRDFLDRMNAVPEEDPQQFAIVTAMHALDHLRRMHARLQQTDRIDTLCEAADLQVGRRALLEVADDLLAALDEGIDRQTCIAAERFCSQLSGAAEAEREKAITHAVEHDLSVAQTNQLMSARRWLEHMAHHVWRISAHLGGFTIKEEEPD